MRNFTVALKDVARINNEETEFPKFIKKIREDYHYSRLVFIIKNLQQKAELVKKFIFIELHSSEVDDSYISSLLLSLIDANCTDLAEEAAKKVLQMAENSNAAIIANSFLLKKLIYA